MRITSAITITIIFIGNIFGTNFIINNYCVAEQLPFETIRIGHSCSHTNKSDYVINTYQEWENLWNLTFSSVYPMPIVPNISFTENTIIASFLGVKPTSGYSIEIFQIVENIDQIIVHVEEKSPNPTDGTFQVITMPFHLVKTEKIIKEIIFNHFHAYYTNSINSSLLFIFSICVICGLIPYFRSSKKKLR